MKRQPHGILRLLISIILFSLLAGCTSQPANSPFTVRVSGDSDNLAYEGQCTAQRSVFWSRASRAVGLDLTGTIEAVDQPHDYETSGVFIYCAIANQSATGIITVELLEDGDVVASAESPSADKPATLEFGQQP